MLRPVAAYACSSDTVRVWKAGYARAASPGPDSVGAAPFFSANPGARQTRGVIRPLDGSQASRLNDGSLAPGRRPASRRARSLRPDPPPHQPLRSRKPVRLFSWRDEMIMRFCRGVSETIRSRLRCPKTSGSDLVRRSRSYDGCLLTVSYHERFTGVPSQRCLASSCRWGLRAPWNTGDTRELPHEPVQEKVYTSKPARWPPTLSGAPASRIATAARASSGCAQQDWAAWKACARSAIRSSGSSRPTCRRRTVPARMRALAVRFQ